MLSKATRSKSPPCESAAKTASHTPASHHLAGYRWPDNVLVVARGRLRRTVVLEVDGPKYHVDAEAERRRDAELGGPVVHVHHGWLRREDGLGEILEQVWEKLGLSGAGWGQA